MNLGFIITAGFAVIVAIATLVGYSKGKKYVWQYTLTRLIINVLAVVIALPLTRFVSLRAVGSILTKAPLDSMGDAVSILTSDLTVAMGVVEALLAMVLGLVFFLFIRIIVKAVLKLFKYFIFAVISLVSDSIGGALRKRNAPISELSEGETTDEATKENAGEVKDGISDNITLLTDGESEAKDGTPESIALVTDGASELTDEGEISIERERRRGREGCFALKPQLASILIGIIGCIFGVVVVFAPFTGAIALADEALALIGENIEEGDEDYESYTLARSVTDSLPVRLSNSFGGKLIFNRLTTYNVNGTKIKLASEAELATAIAGSVNTITDENAEKEAQKGAVADVINAFERSAVIPLVLSDVLDQLALSIDGDGKLAEAVGLKVGDSENLSGKLTVELLHTFKGCTPDSIKQDARTLADIVLIVIDHEAVSSIEKPNELLSNRALVEELLTVFFENDRFSSVASTIVEMGIGMLESELGMTDTLESAHGDMLNELGAINTNATDGEITKEVTDILTSYGIDVTDEGAHKVAEALKYYGPQNALLKVEVKGEDAPVNIASPGGFESVSLLITKNEIKISHKDSIKDPAHEAHLIAEALYAITDLTASLNGEVSISAVLSTIGKLLDNLSETEMVGKGVVDKLVVVMFQSEKVTGSLPLNTVEATKFVDSLVSGSEGEGKGYETVMGGIADMVDVLGNLSSTESADDPIEAVTETLKNITPESAEALKHFATTDFVKDIGVGEESSEGVANVLGNLFDELATAKDEDGLGLSDEEYAEEAEKISNLLDVTMSITDGTSDTSDVAIESYVNDVMDSKILTNTIINSVYDEEGNLKNDPLNTEIELSGDEKTELGDSLNQKLSEITNAEYESEEEKAEKLAETEKLIIAIGAYINTEVTIENGEVKIG